MRTTLRIVLLTATVASAAAVAALPGVLAAGQVLPRIDPEKVGLDAARLEDARDLLTRFVSDQKIAGAVAMVARNGQLAFVATPGVQDRQTRAPMAEDTLFRIYSMTKPVTAVAVMMLFEQGKFSLDDPVSRYLPEFAQVKVEASDGTTRPPSRPVTIRDLLLHTSGLNHRTSREYQVANVRARSLTLPQFVSNVVRVPLKEDPGATFRYSEATTVLGRLVEIWSGERFDRFLEQRIFQPLKMVDTTFVVRGRDRARLAASYGPAQQGGLVSIELEAIPFTEEPALLEGAVGLVSTAPDYLRFSQMLLNGGSLDGAQLLRPATVTQLMVNSLTPEQRAGRRDGTGWGLGNVAVVMQPSLAGYPSAAGDYGWDGTAGTIFWVEPERKMIIILMTQIAPANPDRLRQQFKTLIDAAVN